MTSINQCVSSRIDHSRTMPNKQGCSAPRHSVANSTPALVVNGAVRSHCNRLRMFGCGLRRALQAGADRHVPRHQTSIRSRERGSGDRHNVRGQLSGSDPPSWTLGASAGDLVILRTSDSPDRSTHAGQRSAALSGTYTMSPGGDRRRRTNHSNLNSHDYRPNKGESNGYVNVRTTT